METREMDFLVLVKGLRGKLMRISNGKNGKPNLGTVIYQQVAGHGWGQSSSCLHTPLLVLDTGSFFS